jgi:hypothetical protein
MYRYFYKIKPNRSVLLLDNIDAQIMYDILIGKRAQTMYNAKIERCANVLRKRSKKNEQ